MRNPLLRNGLLLTASAVLSALIGFGYWAVTARMYDAATVGSNSAAISLMMLAAAVAQLNLSNSMARFVPTAGRRTKRLVAGAFVVSGCLAVVTASCVVALTYVLSTNTSFFDGIGSWSLFVIGTVLWTLFVLQDGVLVGLRRTPLVPLENIAFGLIKVVLVVALAAALPGSGIFASWTGALIVTVPIVGAFLFLWAIPRHADRRGDDADTLPPLRQLTRFVAIDYIGAICSVGWVALLPILVLHQLGPVETAYFSVAWSIANAIHTVNTNLGISLVVETATDQSQLAQKARQIMLHGGRLVIPVALVVTASAPLVLGIFGDEYRAGSDVLRLLAFAAIPNIVVATAVSAARARRLLGLLLSIQITVFVLTLGLCAALIPVLGLVGAGWACLLSQSAIAGALILRRDLWLTTEAPQRDSAKPRFCRLRSTLTVIAIRFATAVRQRPFLDRTVNLVRRSTSSDQHSDLHVLAAPFAGDPALGEWTTVRPVRTVTDSRVAFLSHGSSEPTAVLKAAGSPLASAELQAQRQILTSLSADARLDGWRRLLPQVLAFRDDATGAVSIESFCCGIDLETVLSRHPERYDPLTTVAIACIDDLHQATGELTVVDDRMLERWVDRPLQNLTEMCRVLSPQATPLVAQLGALLRSSLTNRMVLVGWAHGDFHAGNVLLASPHGGVTGIVDWGGARSEHLGVLDDYLMLLTASSTVEHRELGSIVSARLHGGGLTARERRQLDIARRSTPEAVRDEMLDERILILLTWLHHLSELSRKCGVYREHRVWWALNAEPVLRTFSQLAPAIEAQLRTAELSTAGAVEERTRPALALTGAGGSAATLVLERPVERLTVSVVICAYTEDRWEALVLAVASAQSQSAPAEEIVVVIDYNPVLLERAEREFRGVTVVPNRHTPGLSGARNTGVDIAVGDVVVFLDDDAIAASDWLAELIAPYADDNVLGVGGRIIPHWRTARPGWFPPEFDWVVGCTYRGMPIERAPIRNMIGANMSLRRELVVESHGFASSLGRVGNRPLGGEETELCIRIQQAHPDGTHAYEPTARVWHSVSAERATWRYFYSRCYSEGLSKAAVSALAGTDRALSSERSYVTRTIPIGIVRHLGSALRGRLWGFVAALALISGVMVTSAGFAVGTLRRGRAGATPVSRRQRITAAARHAGVPAAVLLWLVSLPRIDLHRMGDYGLLPLLPLTFWAALAILLLSFSTVVHRAETAGRLLLAHVVTLIAILHATPSLTYETLRYSWAWKHVAIVEFFERHSGVDTSLQALSAYQFWPGFFNANAMLVKASGVPSSLSYAAWAPPVFNLLLIGPLFLIFSTFTGDRRLIWSGVMIFFLGSWVGQDYFAPQACAYFLYLTIIALVLRYLRPEVRARNRRLIGAFGIVPMMAAIVPTHQLTPLMVICALGLLAVFRARRVALLTALMIALTLGWDVIFAGPWISQDLTGILAAFGEPEKNASSNLLNLADASRSQFVVAQIDRALSIGIWILAFVGFARRFRRGRGELALPLLAIAPLPLILSNDYGGEMIFRVYLFGLPFAAFYAAAAFFPRESSFRAAAPDPRRRRVRATHLALPVVLLLLLTGFSFGYYGKEQSAHFSRNEYAASEFVYGVAPRGSLIIGTVSGFPWAFKNFELYDYAWFATFEKDDREAILADPVGIFSDMMSTDRHHHAYMILTRSQEDALKLTGDLPSDALPRIEQALSQSPEFTVIYRNPEAVVITLAPHLLEEQ